LLCFTVYICLTEKRLRKNRQILQTRKRASGGRVKFHRRERLTELMQADGEVRTEGLQAKNMMNMRENDNYVARRPLLVRNLYIFGMDNNRR
jgi:hypothetical protein